MNIFYTLVLAIALMFITPVQSSDVAAASKTAASAQQPATQVAQKTDTSVTGADLSTDDSSDTEDTEDTDDTSTDDGSDIDDIDADDASTDVTGA
ncbi:MAG: hypothetical protein WCE21_01350 [Candidatus Babeliales bacterium]